MKKILFILLLTVSYSQTLLTGLSSYYKLDETSGSTFTDVTTTENGNCWGTYMDKKNGKNYDKKDSSEYP